MTKRSVVCTMLELRKEKKTNEGGYMSRDLVGPDNTIRRGMFDLANLTPDSLDALHAHRTKGVTTVNGVESVESVESVEGVEGSKGGVNGKVVTEEAFDPGKRALYTGSHGTKMSLPHWRHLTGTAKYAKELDKRTKKSTVMTGILNELSQHSLKTPSLGAFCLSLRKGYISNWNELWGFYGHGWFGQQRFRLKIKQQQAYDKVANDVLGKQRTKVAAFGSAFWKSGKGLPPSPVSMVRDYLARKGTVVMINENLTSQKCSECKSLNLRMLRHPHVHGLFHCTKNGCNRTWNRDVNAALNIQNVYLSFVHPPENGPRDRDCRPTYLRRESLLAKSTVPLTRKERRKNKEKKNETQNAPRKKKKTASEHSWFFPQRKTKN